MAIIWADFPSGQQGLYGSNTSYMLDGIWAQHENCNDSGANVFGLTSDPDPNIGSAGRVLAFSTYNIAGFQSRIVIPGGAQSTVGMGFRLWQNQLPYDTTASNALWSMRTAANGWICSFLVYPDGSIAAYSGTLGSLLGQTGPSLTAGAYHHIETKVVRDAAVGTIEIRVNGISVLELENLNLGGTDISAVAIGCQTGGFTSGNPDTVNYYKDFVLWDGTGSEGNDFQGSVAVHDLYTDGDISLNWTASTGSTGYNLIDETTPNDTDYIQAGDPAPSPAVFSLTDLPEDVTSVRALLPIVRAVKTDGGDCNLQVSVTPNNTDWDDGADRPITTAFTYWWDVSHTSPDTAAAWTPSEVNAAYVKANRTL